MSEHSNSVRFVVFIALLFMILLMGSNIALAQSEKRKVSLNVEEGWNLVSILSKDNIVDGSEIKTDDLRAMFYYDSQEGRYERLHPASEVGEGEIKGAVSNGRAVWIYSSKSGELIYQFNREDVGLRSVPERKVYEGWNFVSLDKSILGSGNSEDNVQLKDVKGSCDIEEVFLYDAGEDWESLSLSAPLTESLEGRGLVMKVSDRCSLDTPEKKIKPPELPGGQSNRREGEFSLCKDYYEGKVYDGFCFTDFEKFVTAIGATAKNGTLRYTYKGSSVERVVNYPTSIETGDFGVKSSFNITFVNNGSKAEEVRISDIQMFVNYPGSEDIDFERNYSIGPQENKTVQIPINISATPNSHSPGGVNRYIYFRDNGKNHRLPRIVLYSTDYHPFYEKEVEVKQCGGRKYTENQGVCNNDVFFPAIGGRACRTDSDCNKYGKNYSCYEYSCVWRGRNIIGPQNKRYKVGILPIYITETDNVKKSMKEAVQSHLEDIIPKMENWFEEEKEYWNVTSKFGFDYFKLPDECSFNKSEWKNIRPEKGIMREEELREIEDRCVSDKEYDILIISIQRGEKFEPITAGISHGEIMASGLKPRPIIHELLHSFGVEDISGVARYQWGDCHLYNSMQDWEDKMHHLCRFEAMQIGWADKYPS